MNGITNQVMEIRFNVEKNERKALVRVIEEILGCKAVFLFAPTMAYTICGYHLDRKGTLSLVEGAEVAASDVRRLLGELSERGYAGEGAEEFLVSLASSDPAPTGDVLAGGSADEAAVIADAVVDGGEADGGSTTTMEASSLGSIRSVVDEGLALTIEVPAAGFSATALENLNRLVAGKSLLIMKAIGAVALPIERTKDTLRFPWFVVGSSDAEVDAYVRFVHALCELAKKQKRVVMKEKPSDPNASEKFAFRCFLLRLNFMGKDYASARKVLLSRLSGNGSFKTGDQNDRGQRKQRGTDPTANATEQSVAGADGEGGGSELTAPLKCNNCKHCAYSADGQLHTSEGEVVDTSKRTLDKYTYYCLNTPRGFRKIKHVNDWTGDQNAPKWCSLRDALAPVGEGVALEGSEAVVSEAVTE